MMAAQRSVQFYERYHPVASRTIHRIVRASPAHADLVQEAMVEAFMSVGRFRGIGSLEAWVAGIAANIALKHLRRLRLTRRHVSESPDDLATEPHWHGSVGDASMRAEYRSLLRHAEGLISALDEKKSVVFLMHDVLGHSLEDIARALGISVSNAQTRLSRCRRELHARIDTDPDLRELRHAWRGR